MPAAQPGHVAQPDVDPSTPGDPAASGDPGHGDPGHGGALEKELAAAEPADDHVSYFLEVAELIEGADEILGPPLLEASARQVDVLLSQALADRCEAETQAGGSGLVDLDDDLLLEPPLDLHARHAPQPLELRLDLVFGDGPGLVEILAAVETEPHDRVQGRVVPQDHRLAGLPGEEYTVEHLPHVQGHEVHVRVPGELQHHVREARARGGAYLHQVVDRSEGLLHRAAHEGLHLLRGRFGILRPYGDRRVGNIRHEVEGELVVRLGPEYDQAEKDHGDRHGTPDGDTVWIHGRKFTLPKKKVPDRLVRHPILNVKKPLIPLPPGRGPG